MEALALRNKVQIAINRGKFDNDPVFLKILEKIRQGRNLQDMVQDYYNTVVPKRPSDRATGKVHLQKRVRGKDQQTHPATMQAMIAAERLASSKGIKFQRDKNEMERMASFMKDHVMEGSINTMGKEATGGREKPTDEEIPLRAAALMLDNNNGYDFHHRRPFNTIMQWESTPRDAGHITSYIADKSLANDPLNIAWQNEYENKGKASAEKFAGQQKREATDKEIADALFKSFINKITKT